MLAKRNSYYILILLLFPIIMMITSGRFGLEDSDSGFIVGLGWRILNGEIPYKDFYYVRPILSPLISAIWLYIVPDYGEVFMIRLINYYQLVFQVFLTVMILKKYYNFKSLNINALLFTIVSVLITSIGTLYFQWHTTDGIFLAVLGIFILTYFNNKNILYIIFSGILLGCSALTKQNFLIVPVLGLLFTFLQFGIKKAITLIVGIIISFGAFYYYLHINNIVDIFKLQNTGSTTLEDLIVAGFISYFNLNKYVIVYIIVSIIFSLILNHFTSLCKKKSLFIAFVLTLVSINSYAFIISGSSTLIPFDKILPIFVVCSFIYLMLKRNEDLRNHYILITLLGISWGSSISWGGQSPLMYFTPILFASYYLLKKYCDIFDSKTNFILILSAFVYFSITHTKLYRSDFIWNTTQDASQISDKMAFIETDNEELKKHLELNTIFDKYNSKRTTILPSMPGAYYIHNEINSLAIDWAMDVEIAYDQKGIIDDLNKCCDYYIVEKKKFGQPIGKEGKFYSSTTDYVKSNYELYDSSYEYFDIYKK